MAVTEYLSTDKWAPMPRFGVEQGEKKRGVDDPSRSGSCANLASTKTEHLETPTLDMNIAFIRTIASRCKTPQLGEWVIPVAPQHQKIGVLACIVLVGHAFGLICSVYNFNCRATLVAQFLRTSDLFAAYSTTTTSSSSPFSYSKSKPDWSERKLKAGQDDSILGITYNFKEGRIDVTSHQHETFSQKSQKILRDDKLPPATASKLGFRCKLLQRETRPILPTPSV